MTDIFRTNEAFSTAGKWFVEWHCRFNENYVQFIILRDYDIPKSEIYTYSLSAVLLKASQIVAGISEEYLFLFALTSSALNKFVTA